MGNTNGNGTTYRLFQSVGGGEQKVGIQEYPSYEEAFDAMVKEYQETGKRWGIQRISRSTWNGSTNTMIQPVWG